MKILQATILAWLLPACLAHAQSLNVVTDIAPVQSLVATVMQGVSEPTQIIPGNTSPHDFALRPSTARALQNADLFIWIGPALTPSLADIVADISPNAKQITLLEIPGTLLLAPRTEPSDDHDHNQEGAHGDHGDIDPHAWLDPQNGILWAREIAKHLAKADPANAAVYNQNFVILEKKLHAQIDAINALGFATNPPRFLLSHDAFQYFEHRFGIPSQGAIANSESAPPTAARLRQLQQMIRSNPIACVLAEPGFNPNLIDAVIEEQPVLVKTVDVLGQNAKPGPGQYQSIIENLASALNDCR